eukprot:4663420-Alexandrium_andersonii.AAC.1
MPTDDFFQQTDLAELSPDEATATHEELQKAWAKDFPREMRIAIARCRNNMGHPNGTTLAKMIYD